MGHEDHRCVELRQIALEPLERGDVEVIGGLVEEQEIRVAGQSPGQRGAGELPSGEAHQAAVELVIGEAQTVHRTERAGAPVPAARML